MVRGDQFIAPGFASDGNGSEIIDYVSVDSFSDADETGAQVAFAYPINVLGGDLWKFVAVMGQAAPRVKMVADDMEDPANIKQAKDADAVVQDFWEEAHADAKQRVLAFHQYTTGPCFGYTPFIVDRQKYGSTTEPNIQVEEVMQPDGTVLPVPTPGEPTVYDNGDVELHLCSVLEVTVPFGMKSLADPGWLDYQFMESKWLLISRFPRLEEFREADPPDEDMDSNATAAAEARDSVAGASGQGTPRKAAEWRFRQVWADPHLFEAITEKSAREIFKRQFPDGIKIAKVGSTPVEVKPEKKTDVWAVCKTGRGEKILDDPLCSDSVPIQRAINDLGNLAIETVLRGIAQTIVDQMLLDRNTVAKKEALPNEMIFTMTPMGTDITKMIAQIPPAQVSNQLVPLFQLFRAFQQDITGIRPELSGGGQATQTYREAKQRKDQALNQLSPQSLEQGEFWEAVAENSTRQRARFGTGQIKQQERTAFGFQTTVVDLASLAEDGYHAEADDGIPMSFTDQADKLYSLLHEAKPEVQQALSLLDPINLDVNLELLQLPNHHSTYENQKAKTINDIQELLKGEPIPGADGAPQPSIPVDQYDDHAFVADFMRQWLVSPGGQEKKLASPLGFENVLMAQQAHMQMAAPPPPTVRAGLNVSGKMETLSPAVQNEILKGAGLPELPPEALIPLPPPLPPGVAPGAPPGGGDEPPPESPESPLPPLPAESEGPGLIQ